MEPIEGEPEVESTQDNVSLNENIVIKEEPRDTEEELVIPENLVIKEELQDPEEVLENVIKEEPRDVEELFKSIDEPRKLLDGNWNEIGLSDEDLEKLKDGRIEELSDEGKQTLQDLNITEEIIADALLTTIQQEADDYLEISDTSEELEEQITKELSKEEVPELPKKTLAEFLLEKGLSVQFTKALIKAGITEDAMKFFESLSFTDEEIWIVEELWEIEKKKTEIVSQEKSDENLSSNGLYLKQNISKPLIEGLRETIERKPFDPIEYLAHWLLYYKVCEDRSRKQAEFELALQIVRERMMRQGLDDLTSTYTDHEEEVPVQDDWDFLNYNV